MEKKKKKGLKIAISVILLVILAVGAGAAYYLYRQVNSGLFFKETRINGYDVSDKTCKEVLLMLEQEYSAPKITVTEGGEISRKYLHLQIWDIRLMKKSFSLRLRAVCVIRMSACCSV